MERSLVALLKLTFGVVLGCHRLYDCGLAVCGFASHNTGFDHA